MSPDDVLNRLKEFWLGRYGSQAWPQSDRVIIGDLTLTMHRWTSLIRLGFWWPDEVHAVETCGFNYGIARWWSPYDGYRSVPSDARLVELMLTLD